MNNFFKNLKKVFLFRFFKFVLSLVILSLFLGGCWNYQDLNKITVVAGMAVDKSKNKEYSLSLEVIVMESAGKDGKIKSSLVEGEGDTIREALEDINRKLSSKLYFGNMQTLVISKKLAETEQIREVLEGFFRDPNRRETVDVFISQEETAKKLITPDPKKDEIASYELKQNNDKNSNESSNTFKRFTFEVYNELKRECGDLSLPMYRIVNQFEQQKEEKAENKNEEEEIEGEDENSSEKQKKDDKSSKKEEAKSLASDGCAIFSGNKMVGSLENECMPYFLFATNQIHSGTFSFAIDNSGESDTATFSLMKNNTKLNYDYENEKLVLYINIDCDIGISELSKYVNVLDEKEIEKFTKNIETKLNSKVSETIKKTQELKSDVCGFGTKIYRSDKNLWKNIKKEWKEIYKNSEIRVLSKIRIVNTGFIIKY